MVRKNILNLRELVFGIGNQMRYTYRFSNCRTISKESVAEHSFYTAFFSLMIGLWVLKKKTISIDVNRLVTHALLHDIEEQFTGDIVRPVKHYNLKTKESIERLADGMVFGYFNRLFSDKLISDTLYKIWKYAKDESAEGYILSLADFISVIAYLNQEIQGGNKSVLRTVDGLEEYMKKFETNNGYAFIKPIILEVREMVNEIIEMKGELK